MAAEIVGTAYVRIRAITAGLAKDISDGVDKGVKDAGPKISKSGEGIGEGLSDGASKSFKKTLPDTVADGVSDSLDAPAVHKAAEKGGEGVASDVSDGITKESKRRNPFSGLLDAIKNLSFGDAVRGKFDGVSEELNESVNLDGLDDRLGDSLSDSIEGAFDDPDVRRSARDGGAQVASDVGDGVDRETRRRNPFRRLIDAFRNLSFPRFDIDLDFGKAGDDAEEGGEEIGRRAGKGIDNHFKKKNPFERLAASFKSLDITGPIGWLAIFGPATLAPIVGTVIAALALVTQALGFIVLAAAGAGAALAGIAAAAIPGFAVLFAAFKTETAQLKKFKEEAKKFLEPWKEIGVATQKNLLPGLTAFLKSIKDMVPLIKGFGGTIGTIVGDFARLAGETLLTQKNQEALGKILDESAAFFLHLSGAALAFIDGFLPFLSTVAPLASQFAASIGNLATKFAEMVDTPEELAALTATFQGWYDKLVLFAGILGDVFVGLFGILSIAGETGTPFFDKIAAAAQKFRDWVASAEGENKIRTFFENAQPVIDEIFRLLGNLFDLIVKPTTGDGGALMFERLATALGILNTVLEDPMASKVVPYILGVVVGLKLLSLLAVPLQGFAKVLDIVSGTLKVFSAVASTIISIAGSLVSALIQIAAAVVKLVIAFVPLIFTPVGAALVAIAVAAGLVFLAVQHWDEIIGVLQAVWDWFMRLSTPVKILVALLIGPLVAAFAPLIAFVGLILAIAGAIKNWDRIVEIVGQVKDALIGFVTNLPAMFQQAMTAVGEFFTNLPQRFQEFLAGVGGFFAELPGKVKEAIIGGLEDLPGLLLDAFAGLFEAGQNLVGLLAEGLAAALPALLQFFIELPVKILTTLADLALDMLGIGIQIIGFLAKGLSQALPDIFFFFLRLPIEIATVLRDAVIELLKLGRDMLLALLRGLNEEKGRILSFFLALPGNILRAAITAVKFLLNLGKDMILAIVDGVRNNVGRLFSFFTGLPGRILGLLGDVGSILLEVGGNLIGGIIDGVTALLGSLDELFFGLPARVLGAIGDLFGFIWQGLVAGTVLFLTNVDNWIISFVNFFIGLPARILAAAGDLFMLIWDGLVAGTVTFLTNVDGWILSIIGFFTSMPSRIIEAVGNLGSAIWGAITGGLGDTATNIAGWIADRLTDFANWVVDLPGKLVSFGANLLENIVTGLASASGEIWIWISDRLTDFVDFVADLPGKLVSFGANLLKNIATGLADGLTAVTTWISDVFTKIKNFVTDIPDKLAGLASGIVTGIKNLIKSAWNKAVDLLPSLTIPIPFTSDITISADGLKMAMGGIIPGTMLGTHVIVSEGGRSEAVIPLERPARALALLQEAGLDQLVLDAYLHGLVPGTAGTAGAVTMLHIDRASFTAPVDADLVVQKINSAYRRIAS